jgi:hypothetical protein
MIDTKAKTAFWEVVEDCLVKFHDTDKSCARTRSQEFREEVESGAFPSGDKIYHEEPFDLACAIAKMPEQSVDQLFDKSYSEYEKILKKRGW